jgi:acetyl-CoA carboxylase biotin carboxylase subunit
MIKRILIANRGEIAVRIIRACKARGIHTIAVFSTADRTALHTMLADEAICIGPPEAAESYLKIANIIAAAEITDAQAIHPGYGFLSENPKFANICRECRFTFIGPNERAISLSGDKAACRQAMKEAGVPVVPGSEGIIQDPKEAARIAERIGYPVLVKAAAGGGGKGMRIAHNEATLMHAVAMATSEAQAAFGDGGVYLEKFIENARHIEFQVLGDEHGNVVVLGERECTIQRRHQNLLKRPPLPL